MQVDLGLGGRSQQDTKREYKKRWTGLSMLKIGKNQERKKNQYIEHFLKSEKITYKLEENISNTYN